jgi:hypothetical protein
MSQDTKCVNCSRVTFNGVESLCDGCIDRLVNEQLTDEFSDADGYDYAEERAPRLTSSGHEAAEMYKLIPFIRSVGRKHGGAQ